MVLHCIKLGFGDRYHVIYVGRPKVMIKEVMVRVPAILQPHDALGIDVAHMLRENVVHNLPSLTVVHLVRIASMGTMSNHLQVHCSIPHRKAARLRWHIHLGANRIRQKVSLIVKVSCKVLRQVFQDLGPILMMYSRLSCGHCMATLEGYLVEPCTQGWHHNHSHIQDM
jgi:hypothetical protein